MTHTLTSATFQLEIPADTHNLSAEERQRSVAEVFDDRGGQLQRVDVVQFHQWLSLDELLRVRHSIDPGLHPCRDRPVLPRRDHSKDNLHYACVCQCRCSFRLRHHAKEYFNTLDRKCSNCSQSSKITSNLFSAWHASNVRYIKNLTTRRDYKSQRLEFHQLHHLVHFCVHQFE